MSADPFTATSNPVGFTYPGDSNESAAQAPATTGYTPPTAATAPVATGGRPPELNRWERRRRVKLQARKVRRIIRYISPWSVFRISVIFFFFIWATLCVAAVVSWVAARRAGYVEQIEELIVPLLGLEEFTLHGDYLFNRFAVIAGVLCLLGVILSTLGCVIFNLISDMVGGIRLTVIEEESVRFRPPKRKVQKPPQQNRR